MEDTAVAPTITSDWVSTLTSSSNYGNQWYLNDSIIVGETNQDLIATPPYGSYQVLFTNLDGCSAWSTPLVITAGLNEISNLISTSPNPTNSIIEINYDNEINEIELINNSGQIVDIERISSKKYSLEKLPIGNYILRIFTSEGIYTSKIVRL